MFGYGTEARLKLRMRERWEAQKTWPFLTEHDLQSIRSRDDLAEFVQTGKGISPLAAIELANDWMNGHQAAADFRTARWGCSAPFVGCRYADATDSTGLVTMPALGHSSLADFGNPDSLGVAQ